MGQPVERRLRRKHPGAQIPTWYSARADIPPQWRPLWWRPWESPGGTGQRRPDARTDGGSASGNGGHCRSRGRRADPRRRGTRRSSVGRRSGHHRLHPGDPGRRAVRLGADRGPHRLHPRHALRRRRLLRPQPQRDHHGRQPARLAAGGDRQLPDHLRHVEAPGLRRVRRISEGAERNGDRRKQETAFWAPLPGATASASRSAGRSGGPTGGSSPYSAPPTWWVCTRSARTSATSPSETSRAARRRSSRTSTRIGSGGPATRSTPA